MKEAQSRTIGIGTRTQSGIPRRAPPVDARNPRGMLVRGVVVATYVTDSEPAVAQFKQPPLGVYCDVLAYSSLPSVRSQMLRLVPVLQQTGIQDGHIWKPRAVSLDVTQAPLDVQKGTLPAHMDGDHVLVGFLDSATNLPIILGLVPHPSNDIGHESDAIGHRQRLKVADGDPDFWKHHGSYYGVTDSGNFVVDTTHANDGHLESNGQEPVPPTDGKGAQTHNLPQDATYKVVLLDMAPTLLPQPQPPAVVTQLTLDKTTFELLIEAGAAFKVEGKATTATVTVGNGAVSATIAERMQALYTEMQGKLQTCLGLIQTHIHPTAWGPCGPSPALVPTPSWTVPLWTTAINSNKLKFPDGGP